MVEEALRLCRGNVRLEVLTLGATLRRFEVLLPSGEWRNIVLGSAVVSDYLESNRYVGMTVGRFANRIAGARFALDGREYLLDANEPPNHLHGGAGGFHSRTWTVCGSGEDWVELKLISPAGEQGYPGEVEVMARYQVLADGAQVTYLAHTSEPTVLNVTTHPYFNLNGEDAGTNTDRHQLQIHASSYTPNWDDGIPTGEIRKVEGSAADFRNGCHLGRATHQAEGEGITRRGGFDHSFVVDGEGIREHCRLVGPDGLTLTIVSDQPALQVYGGDHFDGTQVGTSGVPYVRRAGVALETQGFPDAPNHAGFPTTVLRPGEIYRTTTSWLVGSRTDVGLLEWRRMPARRPRKGSPAD
ncbi:Aldose 1-epimerase [Propionicimonas sp. T2.31MG-18]|uniref:aldose epimerase family protein n=1 Tax=Propionicimonas sp. T2.31MG-18 TaxID=3157620 RepID=UPI0035F0D7DB